MLTSIVTTTQSQTAAFPNAIFWEMFKPAGSGSVTATEAAQAICNVVIGAASGRCNGTIPTA